MAVLSKIEADNVFESWSLASDDKEMHGGGFLLKLVLKAFSLGLQWRAIENHQDPIYVVK